MRYDVSGAYIIFYYRCSLFRDRDLLMKNAPVTGWIYRRSQFKWI